MAQDSNPTISSATTTSAYAGDPFLEPFLADDFDPVDYFNSILPTWTPSSSSAAAQKQPQQQQQQQQQPGSSNAQGSAQQASLAEISNQTQAHITKLNTQLSTLSNTLTQLVDEILRSGSRLGYEVEVLRSDTASLQDVIHETLRDDIAKFSPHGKNLASDMKNLGLEAAPEAPEPTEPSPEDPSTAAGPSAAATPEYITRLRTLCTVRDRLDEVVQTFGAAIDWPMAPSDIAAANGPGSSGPGSSAFISISAPTPATNGSTSTTEEQKAMEVQGKDCAEKLRAEIETLVGDGTDLDGLNAATRRVEELAELAIVWRGTIEEKARTKFVESLAKIVDEKKQGSG